MHVNKSVKFLKPLLLLTLFVTFSVSMAISATPIFTGCPDRVTGSHCDSLLFQVSAMDTSNSGNRNNIRYHLVSGPGSVDERTGLWLFYPDQDSSLVGRTLWVEISASVGQDTTHGDENCRFGAIAYNKAPYLSTCDQEFELEVGETLESWYHVTERDSCDVWSYVSVEIWPQPVGYFEFSLEESHSLFTPAPEDNNQVFVFSLSVTDGYDTTICNRRFTVGEPPPFALRIEQKEGVIQGGFTDVSILVAEQPVGFGGFNLLVSYDATALTFQGAWQGSMLDDCGWEYFTYRYGADGNCEGGCPSGLIRLVGIAETNNGPNHPSCYEVEIPYPLASMNFLVSNDRNLECQFIPIRFFWIECGDNSLTSSTGRELYLANTVKDWDYDSTGIEDIGPPESFPSHLGMLESCLNGSRDNVRPLIDFYNGGMEIICADSIDDRCRSGDIDFSGQVDLGDLVLYANLMTMGSPIMSHCDNYCSLNYTSCTEATMAISDLNQNGIGLEVADFLLLLNAIIGEAPDSSCSEGPCISTEQGFAILSWFSTIVMETPEPVGALQLQISNSVEPALVNADGFHLIRRFNGAVTTAFVFSPEGLTWPDSGKITWAEQGYIREVRAATYQGVTIPIIIQEPTGVEDVDWDLPESFALYQNYPNPFNPTTTISFDLPEPSMVTLEIFNVTGRKVATINNKLMVAGTHTVTWQGRNDASQPVASGVYLYRLTTDDIVLSKKMLLLK